MEVPLAFALRRETSFCIVADRAVFLDLERDRYLCVGEEVSNALSRLNRDGKANAADIPRLEALVARGLLIESDQEWKPSGRPVPRAHRSLVSEPLGEVRIGGVVSALRHQLSSELSLRTTSLAELLRRIRTRKTHSVGEPRASAERVAQDFLHLNRIVSGNGRCLARSLAVVNRLASFNIYPELVFGVRLYPFTAHCWVEATGCVLTDHHERTAHFTPILAV